MREESLVTLTSFTKKCFPFHCYECDESSLIARGEVKCPHCGVTINWDGGWPLDRSCE